jgi:hypothetical protein
MLSTLLPALIMRRRGEFDQYRAFAMAAAVFVVIAPGFGFQYTAIVGAALLAYDLRAGAIWGLLSGLQLLSFYFFMWDGSFPILSQSPQGPGPAVIFQYLAWGWALNWLIQQWRRKQTEPG